nr:hypothetical protein [Candidatus Freyarchaeota archaeon]
MNIIRKGIYALILSALSFISGIVINVTKVPEAFTNAIGSISNSYLTAIQSSTISVEALYEAFKSYTNYLSQATNFNYLALAVYILGVLLIIVGVYWIYINR